ncbi:Lrp/AsnC ligand binding domain-containing protein [Micromonospora jinlongensis]|uniref:Lrp/AsnC ligand binding domain-containing protein n=1 Tax=Micromonospora jinlongensis TaxID=1287877 RepID=UPI001C543C47
MRDKAPQSRRPRRTAAGPVAAHPTGSALAAVGHALAEHAEVEFAAAATGQTNIIAAVRCRGTEELYAYLNDKIGALDGIRTVETALMLRQIKQLTLAPAAVPG